MPHGHFKTIRVSKWTSLLPSTLSHLENRFSHRSFGSLMRLRMFAHGLIGKIVEWCSLAKLAMTRPAHFSIKLTPAGRINIIWQAKHQRFLQVSPETCLGCKCLMSDDMRGQWHVTTMNWRRGNVKRAHAPFLGIPPNSEVDLDLSERYDCLVQPFMFWEPSNLHLCSNPRALFVGNINDHSYFLIQSSNKITRHKNMNNILLYMISFAYILIPDYSFHLFFHKSPHLHHFPHTVPWAANAAATMLVTPRPPAAPCGLQMSWTWRTAKLNRYDPRCGAMA